MTAAWVLQQQYSHNLPAILLAPGIILAGRFQLRFHRLLKDMIPTARHEPGIPLSTLLVPADPSVCAAAPREGIPPCCLDLLYHLLQGHAIQLCLHLRGEGTIGLSSRAKGLVDDPVGEE